MLAGTVAAMGVLAVIVAAGLLGPLLAAWKRFPIPIVVGEIAAGIIIGPQLLGLVDPDDPLVATLHDAGFALLMFTVGLHLRLHDPALRRAAPRALLAVAATGLLAIPVGILISWGSDLGNPAVVALVLATSSAALALPVLTDNSPGELASEYSGVAAWIVIADVLTIVALPLVTSESSALRVLFASLAVTILAWLTLHLLRVAQRHAWFAKLAKTSRDKGWGLELRLALVLLFALAWIGPKLGTSMLVAGFAAGLAISAFGVSSRLTTQIVGIGEGFLIPAFFVVLGATLQPRGLASRDGLILFAGLVVGTLGVHVLGGLAGRFSPASAMVASVQMGVPLAVVTLGTAQGWLSGEQASSFVAAALVTLGFCAWGAHQLGRALPAPFKIGVPVDLKHVDGESDQ